MSSNNISHQIINLLHKVCSREVALSCKTFNASLTCLSSVNGAPTAKRSVYLPDRTCINLSQASKLNSSTTTT